MAFRIGEIEAVTGSPGDALGPGQFGLFGGPAIALVTGDAGAGDMEDSVGRGVDSVGGVAFAKDQVESPVRRQRDRARAVHRSAVNGRAIRRRLALARAQPRFDLPGSEIDAPHPMVPDIADQQAPLRVEGDAVRLAELRGHSGLPVATE